MDFPYSPFATPYSLSSTVMRARRLDIDGIERLARRHEQAVALLFAGGGIGGGLGQKGLADGLAIGGADLHAVIAGSHPARPHPDITFHLDDPTVLHISLD